ncbi:hypothetical protein PybrP1_009852 [[Pythium] brassicae (nom. inval.)]|nr:hypothetical protein PybrP1_009852 [[Pythium] brassicae (nom. inval.)]
MAPPAVTTFEPDTKYRLLLRVESAEDLAHKSTQGAYCKLYVGDAAVLDGSSKKLTKSASSESNGGGDADDEAAGAKNRVFRTQTRAAHSGASGKSETKWDESFEVSLRDPSVEVLSLRVKSQHRFFCPVVGTFAVYLRHLRVGLQADQWFPLRRGKKETGRIRLHLLITPEHTAPGRAKKRNGSDMAPDVKVALAANFEADRAIQRLVDKQLKDEEERKARLQHGGPHGDGDGDGDGDSAELVEKLEVLAVAKVKEPTVSLLGSGRGSGRGDPRFPVLLSPARSPSNQADGGASVSRDPRHPAVMTSSTTNGNHSPVAPHAFFANVDASAVAPRASDAERERRRAANFARLKDLDALEPQAESGAPPAHVGSGRGSSRRRALQGDGTQSSTRSSSQRAYALFSIPSFGPDELENHRSKRHSGGSSTDSDSLAEYERRLDRKLRKVRRETEKLRKIKRQLRKYIPDLSDSEDASSSASSTSEDERDNQRRRKGSSGRRSSATAAGKRPEEPTTHGSSARSGVSSSRFYV